MVRKCLLLLGAGVALLTQAAGGQSLSEWQQTRIIAASWATPEIRILKIERGVVDVVLGEAVDVRRPGKEGEHSPLGIYSLSDYDAEWVEIAVRTIDPKTLPKDKQGMRLPVAALLHGAQIGDVLAVRANRQGAVYLDEEALRHKAIVFVAGGTGVGQELSFVRELLRQSWQGDIYFIYSMRNPDDFAFRGFLEHLAKEPPSGVRFRLIPVFTDVPGGKRIDAAFIAQKIGDSLRGAHVFLCGPWDMVRELSAGLIDQLGFPRDHIN